MLLPIKAGYKWGRILVVTQEIVSTAIKLVGRNSRALSKKYNIINESACGLAVNVVRDQMVVEKYEKFLHHRNKCFGIKI